MFFFRQVGPSLSLSIPVPNLWVVFLLRTVIIFYCSGNQKKKKRKKKRRKSNNKLFAAAWSKLNYGSMKFNRQHKTVH